MTPNLKTAVKKQLEEAEQRYFWEPHLNRPALKPLNKPCKDCAIIDNFYTPIADKLLEEPVEIQDNVISSWFCHSNCNRGCAGVREYINKNRK